jgi:hypothetical protein
MFPMPVPILDLSSVPSSQEMPSTPDLAIHSPPIIHRINRRAPGVGIPIADFGPVPQRGTEFDTLPENIFEHDAQVEHTQPAKRPRLNSVHVYEVLDSD